MNTGSPEEDRAPGDAEDLFHRCREVPEAERGRWLEEHCSDPGLRGEVLTLLAYTSSADDRSLLDRTLGEHLVAGRRVAGHTLVRVLGVGGMGVVYEATQDGLKRPVALKLMREGFQSPQAVRRFGYEAELLARLRHPAVAQVYDSGFLEESDSQGVAQRRPWFSMELIEQARTLDEFAAQEHPDEGRCCVLLAEVCEAVHHGHQRQVVHRDLKPSNILVDSRGRPKLIDYGIAKALDPEALAMTRSGQLLGTIRYASPEQMSGHSEEVDARTDVYSLGVVAYELLCGAMPYDLPTTSLLEAGRAIAERPPIRPSRRKPRLKGDAEAVLLKALEKRPEDRYASAHEFAADLRALASGTAVRARAPRVLDLLRGLYRRHRIATVSASGALLALLAGIVVATAALVRARDSERHAQDQARVADGLRVQEAVQREAAQDRAREAEASQAVLVEFLDALVIESANPTLAHVASLDRLAARLGEDETLIPILDSLRARLGRAYLDCFAAHEAQAQLELALPALRTRHGPLSREALSCQAHLEYAKTFTEIEDEASRTERLRELEHQLAELHPDAVLPRDVLLGHLGFKALEKGRAPEALELQRTRLSLFDGREGPVDGYRRYVALLAVEEVLRSLRRDDELAEILRRKEELAVALEPNRPGITALTRSLSRLPELGVAVAGAPPEDPAWEALEAACREGYEQVVRESGPESLSTLLLEVYLADVLFRRGRYEDAAVHYRGLCRAVRRGVCITTGENGAATLINASDCFLEIGRNEEALEAAELCLGLEGNGILPWSWVDTGHRMRALALNALDRPDDCEDALLDSLACVPAEETLERAVRLVNLADFHVSRDQRAAAEEALVEAEQTARLQVPPPAPLPEVLLGRMIQLYRRMGMDEVARELQGLDD